MKRWVAILSSVGLAAGMAGAEFIPGGPSSPIKVITQGLIGVLGAYVAKKASESNPNGTPAELPYVKNPLGQVPLGNTGNQQYDLRSK